MRANGRPSTAEFWASDGNSVAQRPASFVSVSRRSRFYRDFGPVIGQEGPEVSRSGLTCAPRNRAAASISSGCRLLCGH